MNRKQLIFLILVISLTAQGRAFSNNLEVSASTSIITVKFAGENGIPSWTISVSKYIGGNIINWRVPANNSVNMSKTSGQWPSFVPQSINWDGVSGTMSNGRENFFKQVSTFDLVRQTPDTVIVSIGGNSPNNHYAHNRIYTFTRKGVTMTGEIIPIIQFRTLGLWGFGDNHCHNFVNNRLPVRNIGAHTWSQLVSSTNDHAQSLPSGVRVPFEAYAEIKNSGGQNLLMRFVQGFEIMDKTKFLFRADRNIIALLTEGRTVTPGNTQHYKMDFMFGDTSFFKNDPLAGQGLGMQDQTTKFGCNAGITVSPNPFKPGTTLKVSSSNLVSDNIRVRIFNSTGRLVSDLNSPITHLGNGTYAWSAHDHPSGIYYVHAVIGNNVLHRPITLIK
jgi:hypothetical protein